MSITHNFTEKQLTVNHFKDNTTFAKEGISLWQFSSISMCWKTSMHHKTVCCYTWGILNKKLLIMTLHTESSHDSEVAAFNALEFWIKLLRAKWSCLGFMWKSLLGKRIIILPYLYSGVLIAVARVQIFNNNKHQVPLSFLKIWGLQLQTTQNWSTGTELIYCKSLILATCYLKPLTQGTLATHTWGWWVTYKS